MKTRKWPKRTRTRNKREAQRQQARTGKPIRSHSELITDQAALDAAQEINA